MKAPKRRSAKLMQVQRQAPIRPLQAPQLNVTGGSAATNAASIRNAYAFNPYNADIEAQMAYQNKYNWRIANPNAPWSEYVEPKSQSELEAQKIKDKNINEIAGSAPIQETVPDPREYDNNWDAVQYNIDETGHTSGKPFAVYKNAPYEVWKKCKDSPTSINPNGKGLFCQLVRSKAENQETPTPEPPPPVPPKHMEKCCRIRYVGNNPKNTPDSKFPTGVWKTSCPCDTNFQGQIRTIKSLQGRGNRDWEFEEYEEPFPDYS
jgi:hypothetical protein